MFSVSSSHLPILHSDACVAPATPAGAIQPCPPKWAMATPRLFLCPYIPTATTRLFSFVPPRYFGLQHNVQSNHCLCFYFWPLTPSFKMASYPGERTRVAMHGLVSIPLTLTSRNKPPCREASSQQHKNGQSQCQRQCHCSSPAQ